jgi:hypothetical protein
MTVGTRSDTSTRLAELGLVDPTHRPSGQRRVAPRLATLAGMRAGLLDNRKGNADRLLERVGELLRERYGVAEVRPITKYVYSRRADPAILDRLASSCDFVVTAIGD